MVIEELPIAVVKNLGSSQALATSVAAVKELVDNALDARAISVTVEISRNSLDIVQVRDNGCGIPPEDRRLIAKPHCTSKINNESDLRLLGGSSLGFRGEALASAAQLSGLLTMITRVEGEPTAVELKFSRNGDIQDERNVSSPVGTLARISDFFQVNPVRRQSAIKNADTTLKHVKKMLQEYALARPQVRFSLKVIKSPSVHGDWIYAPQLQGDTAAMQAVSKIVGLTCASQCIARSFESDGFVFSSVLPRCDADASKVGGFGSFISIDHRPVSSSRGTLRKIVECFHDALKKGKSATLRGVKSPFLQLGIACPQGAYDINVEPSKDDVLFEDPSAILSMVTTFFQSVYPASDARPESAEPCEPVSANGFVHRQGNAEAGES
ncbi:uncharacterized protein K489DRAFT_364083 [Dissoconium aciculare CBS 342.82]|uniref:DNA mismatch repair protein S5 domain-containing protein n=1 Tax=Dissoconium aciculare CBS 342.82 TaxID=1314786 RepID=A0A6J3LTI3_9PEZI|nr:uncharacterized protein K489DRAFT_364083 [Dissoconium aciculare CBS 342.82]KAF1818943.1 hypothetical protein K489DRAFT_364083 [Dissoconium aciculare CBS 342.82]